MPQLPTRLDLFNIGAAEIQTRSLTRPPGQRVDPAQVFTEGSDINIITASSSAMAEEVTRQVALRIKALFLDGAEGEDLDRLVADRFSPTIVRKSATPSIGFVQISRGSGPLAGITFSAGTKFRTTSGIEFESTANASILAGSTGPVSIPVRAVTAGLPGNVSSFTVTQFASPPSDPALAVTNAEPMAGGDDNESDARLRERARRFFLTARRGTLSAIQFGALTVPGVRVATAAEETLPNGDPTGRVFVYIADALGNGNSALAAAVRIALVEYRAAGVIVDVIGAQPLFVNITYNLRFAAGVDSLVAFEQVRFATVAAVNALAPNATLEVSQLFAIARSIPGVIVLDDAIVAPVGDLVPPAGRVIKTAADLVTAL